MSYNGQFIHTIYCPLCQLKGQLNCSSCFKPYNFKFTKKSKVKCPKYICDEYLDFYYAKNTTEEDNTHLSCPNFNMVYYICSQCDEKLCPCVENYNKNENDSKDTNSNTNFYNRNYE